MFFRNYWASKSLEVQKKVNKIAPLVIGHMLERGFFGDDPSFIVKEDKKMMKNLGFYCLLFRENRNLEDFYIDFVERMKDCGYTFGVYSKTNYKDKTSPYLCKYSELNTIVRNKISYFHSEFIKLV